MKFLIDEDVPAKLMKALAEKGHDCIRVDSGASDRDLAERSRKENRMLITLDKDFADIAAFPPEKYTIIRFQIHPPYADALIKALDAFLASTAPEAIKGLVIIEKAGHIRLTP